MKPTRAHILSILRGMRRAGQLPSDGPTSIFLANQPGASHRQASQLVVRVDGERVSVRTSRLPLVKPLAFSLSELAAEERAEDE